MWGLPASAPGADSVPNGGTCAPAVAGATHNWNGTEFRTCVGGGELTVTLNAWSLTPYTGASCGWSAHLNAMLYACALGEIDLQDGCANLVQDSATTNLGAGFMTTGGSFTFTSECWVNGAGVYTFASMPGCDQTGAGAVTGSGDWSIDFP